MACNLPDSSVHGIFQARILEWIAISFFRGSPQPRDWTRVFCITGRFFTIWATGKFLLFLCIVHLRRPPYLSLLFFGTLLQLGISFPFSLAFHSSSLLSYSSSDNHLASLHFFFLWMILVTASCTMFRTSVHSSSGTLSIRSSPLNLFITSIV